MSTAALISRLLHKPGPIDGGSVDALRELLDDSTIERDAEPVGIAEAAALVGLSAHTLRYYEGEGLLRPARNSADYREYGPADLRRLVFLTRMRLSGMVMQDLKRYIALAERGPETVPERRAIMLAQQVRIKQELRELTLALKTTEFKICSYAGAPSD